MTEVCSSSRGLGLESRKCFAGFLAGLKQGLGLVFALGFNVLGTVAIEGSRPPRVWVWVWGFGVSVGPKPINQI